MGILLYSALVVDGNMISMQMCHRVPWHHMFLLFSDCVYCFAKEPGEKMSSFHASLSLVYFSNVLYSLHNRCKTQAGRLPKECVAHNWVNSPAPDYRFMRSQLFPGKCPRACSNERMIQWRSWFSACAPSLWRDVWLLCGSGVIL